MYWSFARLSAVTRDYKPRAKIIRTVAQSRSILSFKNQNEKYVGNKNKGKGNGAGLAWESQSHCFADEFVITHAHSLGTGTQHETSQGNCRTMSSIIIKLITSSLL